MNIWGKVLLSVGITIGAVVLLGSAQKGWAAEVNDLQQEEIITIQEEAEEEILDDLELKEVEELVKELTEDKVSFSDLLKTFMDGGQIGDWKNWKEMVSGLLQEIIGTQKETCIQILLLLLLTSFFGNLSTVFKTRQMEEMAFYMCYLVLFLLVIHQVERLSGQLQESMEGTLEFMRVLLPSYYLAIAASTGVTTAAVFYQMIMGIVYAAEQVIVKFLLPAVRFYLLIELINHLTKEELLSRMADLIKNGISWVLKTMIGLVFGMQVVQKLVSPAVDSLKRTVLGKTAGAIPVVGDIFDGVTEIVLGSAVLIKNCLGAAAIICMLLIGLSPILQLGIYTLGYQILAAVMQPVAEKRMIACIHTTGETIGMLLKLLLTVEMLFLLTIAIIAGTSA